ncbi:hypothetical protein ACJIZ3_004301 [Penstemon smallii]|uniref:Transposase n=1 Tax=Penstemon smallii TaxID=265156 RepID=A0ABD3S1W0_9LAMI
MATTRKAVRCICQRQIQLTEWLPTAIREESPRKSIQVKRALPSSRQVRHDELSHWMEHQDFALVQDRHEGAIVKEEILDDKRIQRKTLRARRLRIVQRTVSGRSLTHLSTL